MTLQIEISNSLNCRSRRLRGLRRESVAARFLGLRVRIPPRTRMSVSCECCMLSGRGLCVGLITRPEKSYRVWFVWLYIYIYICVCVCLFVCLCVCVFMCVCVCVCLCVQSWRLDSRPTRTCCGMGRGLFKCVLLGVCFYRSAQKWVALYQLQFTHCEQCYWTFGLVLRLLIWSFQSSHLHARQHVAEICGSVNYHRFNICSRGTAFIVMIVCLYKMYDSFTHTEYPSSTVQYLFLHIELSER